MSKTALIKECQRLSESCLYTSTSLFIWVREKRRIKNAFIFIPLLLGSIAGWSFISEFDASWVKWVTGVFSFVAGLMPALYSALKLDDHLETCKRSAGEFKNLQDRFRQVALIYSGKSLAEFESEFGKIMAKFEKIKSESLTPPERFFKAAQKKINTGDYTFTVDLPDGEADSR